MYQWRSRVIQTPRLQPTVSRVSIQRSSPNVLIPEERISEPATVVEPDAIPHPYPDYARFLTPQGGIAIIYKDIDDGLLQTLWRIAAWLASTGSEAWFLLHHSPVHDAGINVLCLIGAAVLNWLIVGWPAEIYRSIEIRPDCMILNDNEIFWRRFMEVGWPSFKPDAEGNQVLCGIYGTRWVEFLTVRRFDEYDRMPEVIAAHLQDAMRQSWQPHTAY